MTRMIYENDNLISEEESSAALSFSKTVPSLYIDLILFPELTSDLVVELTFEYLFLKRRPEKKFSLPTDWNRINGELALHLDFGYQFH